MGRLDSELERLLRAAAAAAEASREEAPFGFDTRVVALWQSQRSVKNGEAWSLAAFAGRIAIGATIVAAAASGGAIWQLKENEDLDEPVTNAYALADSVIEAGTWQ